MPPVASMLAFAVASVILIVIPGPSVLFTVGRALAYGRRTALATVCGNAAGNYLVASCVAVGLGTVVQRSAQVFLAVRLAGALYLIWLGVQAFRRRASLAGAFAADAPGRSDRRAVREGFVVGVTNPKAYILFGAVLPQFVDRAAGHVPVQMLLLALISIAIGLVSDTTWALAAGGLRAWFARSPRRFALVGGAGGLAMIGVGISVAVTGRSSQAHRPGLTPPPRLSPGIAGVLATIGGDDLLTVLPFLDPEVVVASPKPYDGPARRITAHY